MSKLKVNALLKDELEYELTIKGLSPQANATVEDMRRSLRTTIWTEAALNDSCVTDSYPFTFQEDREALEKKVQEVEAIAEEWKTNRGAAVVARCEARVEFA